jgi:hypothetical protein
MTGPTHLLATGSIFYAAWLLKFLPTSSCCLLFHLMFHLMFHLLIASDDTGFIRTTRG